MNEKITFGIEVEHTDQIEADCDNCGGSGDYLVECPDCAGQGQLTFTCRNCDGKGEYIECDHALYSSLCCRYCLDGIPPESCIHLEDRQTVLCDNCGGSGQIEEECSYCDGTGEIYETCEFCHGEGYLDRDRVYINNRLWDVKRDCSCGSETVSPILNWHTDLVDVKAVAEEHLEYLDCAPSCTCGLHVHVGANMLPTQRHLETLAKLWVEYEPLFWQIADPALERTDYCKRWNRSMKDIVKDYTLTPDQKIRSLSSDRYRALNFQSLGYHGTVEFRLWNSTSDYNELEEAITLSVGLVRLARVITNTHGEIPLVTSTETLKELLRMAAFDYTNRKEDAMKCAV